jgi:putative hydrolase of the HAD superfamily
MKIYRNLPTIAAISFDLDDTLYDNVPIILQAEHALVTWLSQQFPQHRQVSDPYFWRQFKALAIKHDPALVNDVTLCRKVALQLGFQHLGVTDKNKRDSLSEEALAHFLHWRNNIPITPTIDDLLQQLSAKFPLVVITNGNANIEHLSIAKYFSAIYAADYANPMKPAPTMYMNACDNLSIHPRQLLHVGDSVSSDVLGAHAANCPSVWFNPHNHPLDARSLPDIEIQALTELVSFL